MNLKISNRVKTKLTHKHNVREEEIVQCFANREKGFLKDTRENHASDPPTLWFVSETDYGRKLKVVFIQESSGEISIKTAYEANGQEIAIYQRVAR